MKELKRFLVENIVNIFEANGGLQFLVLSYDDAMQYFNEHKVFDKPANIANLTATSSTVFYTISSNNEITITKGISDENDVMGKILSYKDYPGTNDYVYTYIVNDSLRAVYVIKK